MYLSEELESKFGKRDKKKKKTGLPLDIPI